MPAATISIDPKLTYTKSAYARAFGVNRTTLDKDIAERKIKTIEVRGTILVIAKQG